MKKTKTGNTPAIRIIDGRPFVRVIDLAHLWNTSTASILATGKPHHVPEEHIRRIDGRVWCSLAGLRYRLRAAKQGSQLSGFIRGFLDTQEEKNPTVAKTEPEPTPTDLGTAALIADARRTASQALAKTETLEKRTDAAESIVKSCANIAEEASEAVDRVGTTAQRAADLAQENADIITVTGDRISLRLDRLSEHVDRVEKDAAARHDDALARIRSAERKQRDNAARIGTLEEHARAIDWTIAAVAMLGVVGRLIRLLHRR